ncbi:MAG: response regulator [Vicinamibacterales bacterium]
MDTTLGMVAIVEDDGAMRTSIERLLRASGYETTAFASAEEFLASPIVDRAIGLVLDVHLGGMSGIELGRRLSSAQSPLPIVFVTAHDDEAARREALTVGCVDYLRKPFDANRLTEALERGRNARPHLRHRV